MSGFFYEFGYHAGMALALLAMSAGLYGVLLMVVPSVRRWALGPVTRRLAARRARDGATVAYTKRMEGSRQ